MVAGGDGPCIPIPGQGPVAFHTVAAGAVEVANEALIALLASGNGLLKPTLSRSVVDGDARPAVFIESGDVEIGIGVANGDGLFIPALGRDKIPGQAGAALLVEAADEEIGIPAGVGVAGGNGLFTPEACMLRLSYQLLA